MTRIDEMLSESRILEEAYKSNLTEVEESKDQKKPEKAADNPPAFWKLFGDWHFTGEKQTKSPDQLPAFFKLFGEWHSKADL